MKYDVRLFLGRLSAGTHLHSRFVSLLLAHDTVLVLLQCLTDLV